MSARIANAPVSWGVSEATGGRQPAPSTFLAEVAACGYAGTELGPLGYLPTDPPALRSALAGAGLALVGAFCPVRLHEEATQEAALRDADELIALLAAGGATVLVLADAGDDRRRGVAGRVPADGSASLTDAEWEVFAAGASEIARRAAAHGLRTDFHPHAATYVETPDEIAALLDRTDPALVGLCLDTGHVTYGGGDAVALARRYRPRIGHVHLKDVRRALLADARAAGWTFAEAVARGVFPPLGGGDVDFPGVVAALGPAYAGWYVVEQDRVVTDEDPATVSRDDAARSRRYIADVLARAGAASR